MLHELPDLSRLLDSAPARSNYGFANLITLVRLRDEVRQSMLGRCGEPDLEGHVKPAPTPLAA
jgi:hypothetical protein